MMTARRNLKVSILGSSYSLATDEDADVVYQAAAMVDSLLQGKGGSISSNVFDKIAVVTALQLAADLIKMKKSLDEYEGKCKALLQMTIE